MHATGQYIQIPLLYYKSVSKFLLSGTEKL